MGDFNINFMIDTFYEELQISILGLSMKQYVDKSKKITKR